MKLTNEQKRKRIDQIKKNVGRTTSINVYQDMLNTKDPLRKQAYKEILVRRKFPLSKKIKQKRYSKVADVPLMKKTHLMEKHPTLPKKEITVGGKKYVIAHNLALSFTIADRRQILQEKPAIMRKKKNKYGWWDYYVYREK